jgi:hypothetical protein
MCGAQVTAISPACCYNVDIGSKELVDADYRCVEALLGCGLAVIYFVLLLDAGRPDY